MVRLDLVSIAQSSNSRQIALVTIRGRCLQAVASESGDKSRFVP
jgi:hypothetical protein